MRMLLVENLSKAFGELKVLQNVNLTVEQGECIALIGHSGCGKSVFLRLLELLEQPDSGKIFIGEDEITSKNVNVDLLRCRMGMVYQDFHLFEHLNIMENILLAPMIVRKTSREQATKKAWELLEMVGLESKAYAMPNTLSGGQQQRIAICRCLAMDPQIMLFDEPTSALDPTMVGEVLATIRMLTKQNMTMLIVTHEMAFAREVASRVLYFDECGIYEHGSPKEIFDHPQRHKTKEFVRKLKFYSVHIDRRDFDLMRLQGCIRNFAERYAMTDLYAHRLQLCTEELVYEMLYGCTSCTEEIDLQLEITYGELEKTVELRCDCAGHPYNPFTIIDDENIHLGLIILRQVARSIHYSHENSRNIVIIQL